MSQLVVFSIGHSVFLTFLKIHHLKKNKQTNKQNKTKQTKNKKIQRIREREEKIVLKPKQVCKFLHF